MKNSLLLILLITWLSPMAQEQSKLSQTRGIRVMQHITVLDSTGKSYGFDSSFVEIFTNEDLILYKLNYQFESSLLELKLIEAEQRQHYFIFAKDSLYGFDLDGYKSKPISKVRVDSLLNKEWIGEINSNKMFTDMSFKLISSAMQQDPLQETYQLISKKTPTQLTDTCYVEYIKQTNNLQEGFLQLPIEKTDMRIHKIHIHLESCSCKIDIRYAQSEILEVSQNVLRFFKIFPDLENHYTLFNQ